MHLSILLSIFAIVVSASPFPGLIHDKPHHTHETLVNLHKAPHCAYDCFFDDKYTMKFAPECVPLQNQPKKGLEFGACLCRANGYQYMLDKCVEVKCSPGERKEVRVLNAKNCIHYGVNTTELFKLEKIKPEEL